AQEVLAGELFELVVGPAAADELGEEVWIARDVLEADRDGGHAVEVAAEADVVDAGDRPDVLDVIGDLSEGRARERGGLDLGPPASPGGRIAEALRGGEGPLAR